MTYLVGGLIQANDYNLFAATATPNVNQTWSTGTGNSGYGQPALNIVTPGDTVFASDWAALYTAIQDSADHQGTTLLPFINPNPVAGEVIAVETVLSDNISSIYASRLNAVAQGSTSTTVATSVSTWTQSMTMTFTVAFNDQDHARYFFNAGGQLGLSFYHPGSDTINNMFNLIASRFGTVWLSSPTSGSISLSSVSYQGVTQIGGTTSGSTINSNLGFYALTLANQQIAEKYESSAYYYNNSFITINARSNGAGTITFTVLWDEVPDAAGTVTAGSTGTLTVKPPSTSFLDNTWGTPAVTTSITSL